MCTKMVNDILMVKDKKKKELYSQKDMFHFKPWL